MPEAVLVLVSRSNKTAKEGLPPLSSGPQTIQHAPAPQLMHQALSRFLWSSPMLGESSPHANVAQVPGAMLGPLGFLGSRKARSPGSCATGAFGVITAGLLLRMTPVPPHAELVAPFQTVFSGWSEETPVCQTARPASSQTSPVVMMQETPEVAPRRPSAQAGQLGRSKTRVDP